MDEHTLIPGFSSGTLAIHNGIRSVVGEGTWWKLMESEVQCRLWHRMWGLHLALGGLWTQWLVPDGEKWAETPGLVFGSNERGRLDLEAMATRKKRLGWICCTTVVQEQKQQAPDAAASLGFNCSWLSEIPASSWGLFVHCLAQEGRGGGGCTRALGSQQHSFSHPCKSQAWRAPTTLPQSRALLQAWIHLLGSGKGKLHPGGLREAAVCWKVTGWLPTRQCLCL